MKFNVSTLTRGAPAAKPDIDENDPRVRLSRLGYRYLREKKIQAAIECFSEILALEPDNNYALVGMGDSMRKTRRDAEAIEYYKRCLENNGDNNFALFGLADTYHQSGEYALSIEYWQRYLNFDQDNCAVLTRVADAYRRLKRDDKAEENYRLVLGLDPENPYAYVGLGWVYFEREEFPEALRNWKHVLELRDRWARRGAGADGGAQKKYGKYTSDSDAALTGAGTDAGADADAGSERRGCGTGFIGRRAQRRDTSIYTAIGNCYYRMRQYHSALPYYQSVLRTHPDSFFALLGMANCYRGLGDYTGVVGYLEKILARDPGNSTAQSRLGDAYMKLGDNDKARECYKNVLERGFDAFAAFGYARLQEKEQEYDSALSIYEELLGDEDAGRRVQWHLETLAKDADALPESVARRVADILVQSSVA